MGGISWETTEGESCLCYVFSSYSFCACDNMKYLTHVCSRDVPTKSRVVYISTETMKTYFEKFGEVDESVVMRDPSQDRSLKRNK